MLAVFVLRGGKYKDFDCPHFDKYGTSSSLDFSMRRVNAFYGIFGDAFPIQPYLQARRPVGEGTGVPTPGDDVKSPARPLRAAWLPGFYSRPRENEDGHMRQHFGYVIISVRRDQTKNIVCDDCKR